MWFKRKLEKKRLESLRKGKEKDAAWKKKKEEKVDRADGDRRKYTLSFPVRTLKFELEKKRSSLRLSQEKWWVGELSANGSYRGVQRKNCGDENVASETIAERNQLKDKTWTGRGKKKKKVMVVEQTGLACVQNKAESAKLRNGKGKKNRFSCCFFSSCQFFEAKSQLSTVKAKKEGTIPKQPELCWN